MTAGSNATTVADHIPVPMLDVKRQNAPLRQEIDLAISKVIDSGAFVHGPACRELESAIADYCGTKHAVGCASGSDALLLALMVLGVGPGDEVIVPSFTFFASASAVQRLGAKPVFADILPDTFNIDPADVARKISPATKAIMPVHLFGQTADMDQLADVAGDLPLVEDAAQSIGAEFHSRRAGSLGTFGCFSFYPTKNLGAVPMLIPWRLRRIRRSIFRPMPRATSRIHRVPAIAFRSTSGVDRPGSRTKPVPG